MKNYTFLLIATILFSCGEEPKEQISIQQDNFSQIRSELTKIYGEFIVDTLNDGRIKLEKKMLSDTVKDMGDKSKNIIDRILNSVSKKGSEGMRGSELYENYEWDLPKENATLRKAFGINEDSTSYVELRIFLTRK